MAQTTAAPRPLSVQVDNRLLVLIAVVAGHAVKHVFNAGSMLILPELKSTLGVSNTSIGLLTTTRSVFGGLINLPAGFVSDRYSGRWAAVLALTLIGVGGSMFLVGISTAFWMAVVSMTLLSMAITFWHPPALAALSVRYPDKRGFAVAMHGTGGSIGEAVGPILTGFLIGFLAWQTVLQLSLIPAILMGVGTYLLLKSIPSLSAETTTRGYFGGVRAALSNPRLLLVLATTACFSGSQIGIMSFLPIYAREDLAMSTTATGALVSLLQVAGIGSQPLLGYLSDLFGRRVVLAIGFAGLTIGTLGLFTAGSGPAFFVAVAFTGLFLFPMMAILLAAAMDVVGSVVQGTTVSFVFGVSIVLAAISGWISGRVADTYGVEFVFLYAAIPAAVAFLLTVAGSRMKDNRSTVASEA
ncbi:MAG: MFS transporter [Chloroflexi bacterium]|nr:MFS transporter [Chloroflexota bacterium]